MDKPRILHIDDDDNQRFVVKRLLKSGYEVVSAADGQEAEAVCNSGKPIDLVLCDFDLAAGEKGPDVIHRLQQQGLRAPVAFLTSNGPDTMEAHPLYQQFTNVVGIVNKNALPAIKNTIDDLFKQLSAADPATPDQATDSAVARLTAGGDTASPGSPGGGGRRY